jgi:hypothetical protein
MTHSTHPASTPSDEYVWVCTYCGKTFDEWPEDSVCRAHCITWAKSQLAMRGDRLVGLKIPKNVQFEGKDAEDDHT